MRILVTDLPPVSDWCPHDEMGMASLGRTGSHSPHCHSVTAVPAPVRTALSQPACTARLAVTARPGCSDRSTAGSRGFLSSSLATRLVNHYWQTGAATMVDTHSLPVCYCWPTPGAVVVSPVPERNMWPTPAHCSSPARHAAPEPVLGPHFASPSSVETIYTYRTFRKQVRVRTGVAQHF